MSTAIRFAAILFLAVIASAQSGGDFVMTKSVIAGGGTTSVDLGSVFSVTGTTGQPNAGDNSSGSIFNIRSGFWTPDFAPTAAHVNISGRVIRPSGDGIRGAVITLTGGSMNEPRIYLTGSFGYFTFEGIEVGQTYLITVTHPRFGFAEPTQVIALRDEVKGIEFISNW